MLHYVNYKNSVVAYYKYGNGKQHLVCLHGYGESGNSFSIFEKKLGATYTLIAIDFPFHGETKWNEGLLFATNDLLAILEMMVGNISHENKLTLFGFSMGGRVAFTLIEQYPQLVAKAILAAPDGLHNNFWHWLATQTSIGNWLFKINMEHAWMIKTLAKLFYKLGLFNKRLYSFVAYYLAEKQSRLLLYKRWVTMRKFNPDKGLLLQQINSFKNPVHLLFGKYDAVILTKRGEDFKQQAADYITVTEIEASHQLLKDKYVPIIVELFDR